MAIDKDIVLFLKKEKKCINNEKFLVDTKE